MVPDGDIVSIDVMCTSGPLHSANDRIRVLRNTTATACVEPRSGAVRLRSRNHIFSAATGERACAMTGGEVCSPPEKSVPLPRFFMYELHCAGRCLPCFYHTRRPGGCSKGDDCNRCHFCNFAEMKLRKRQLQREAQREWRLGAAEKAASAGEPGTGGTVIWL